MSTDEHPILSSVVDQRIRTGEAELTARRLGLSHIPPVSPFICSIHSTGKLTASHFIEFSGVRLPNSRIVTAESCALLKRFESEHVPQNFLPFALNALSRPVAAGAGEPVDVGDEGVVVEPLPVPGWHW